MIGVTAAIVCALLIPLASSVAMRLVIWMLPSFCRDSNSNVTVTHESSGQATDHNNGSRSVHADANANNTLALESYPSGAPNTSVRSARMAVIMLGNTSNRSMRPHLLTPRRRRVLVVRRTRRMCSHDLDGE